MALPNYVKFQRGTLLAYNRLSQKDENTLYFIYDTEDNSKGTLYLGTRLIGSVGGSGGVSNLSELSDVIVSNANTGDFLVLNSEGKWTSVSASEVAQAILSAGGNFVTVDENEFQFNAVDGSLELKGYTNAATNLVPVKASTGIEWTSLPPDLSTEVGNLESILNAHSTAIASIQSDLSAVDNKIITAVANANHLTRQIIDDLTSATAENVIYLYPNGASTATNNVYDEYMIINGRLERTGSTDVDLSQYATTETVNIISEKVGSLTTAVNALNTDVGTLSATVNTLSTAVSAIQSNLDNYVLTTTFTAVVGTLTAVNGVRNTLTATSSISDALIDIYDRLTWIEMSE